MSSTLRTLFLASAAFLLAFAFTSALLFYQAKTSFSSEIASVSSESAIVKKNLSPQEIKEILLEFRNAVEAHPPNNSKPGCDLERFGTEYGGKWTCKRKNLEPGCVFYSFGIGHDYSFDEAFAKNQKCQGLAFDPSVVYKSQLADNVLFFPIGANMISRTELPTSWILTSPAKVRAWLQHKKISMLKMDCEGCEYKLAEDILDHDPTFFQYVDQFSVEFHISKFWIKSDREMHNLTLLLKILKDAGLSLILAEKGPCDASHQIYGCPQALLDVQFDCRLMCSNFFFARV